MENVIRFHDGGQGLFPFKLQPAVQFLFNSLLKMDPQGLLPGLADGGCGARGRVYTPPNLEGAVMRACSQRKMGEVAVRAGARLPDLGLTSSLGLVDICLNCDLRDLCD